MRARTILSFTRFASLAAATHISGQTSNCTSDVSQEHEILFNIFQPTCSAYEAPGPLNKNSTLGLGSNFFLQLFLALFLFIKTALQLNTRPPTNSRRMRVWEIIWQMTWTILTPELVLFKAMTNFTRAYMSRSLMKSIGYRDFTLTHGFHVEMGNVHIQTPDQGLYPLTSKVLIKLCQNKDGSLSSKYSSGVISDHITLDRDSLSDILWASALVLQLFSIHWTNLANTTYCISSAASLEIHVIAIAMCLFFAHGFSWAKPRYMRKPVVFSGISVTKLYLLDVYSACHGQELAKKIMLEKNIPSLGLEVFGMDASFLFIIGLSITGYAGITIFTAVKDSLRLILLPPLSESNFDATYLPEGLLHFGAARQVILGSCFGILFSASACSTIYRSSFEAGYYVKPLLSRLSLLFSFLLYIYFRIYALLTTFTDLCSKLYSIHETLQPRSISDFYELQTWKNQRHLLHRTTYQKCNLSFLIFLGIHAFLWSTIFYIAYRCTALAARRQLYEIYKPPNPKPDPESSVTSLEIFFERNDRYISIADRTKNFIQKFFNKPVIWWPLEPPQKPLLPNTTRLTRECPSCKTNIQFDVPSWLTYKYPGQIMLPAGSTFSHHSSGSQYSSTPGGNSSGTFSQQSNPYTGSASGSRQHSPMNQRNTKSGSSGNSDANSCRHLPSSGNVAINILGPPSAVEKYVHWCVDSSKTYLHDICVESKIGAKKGRSFIEELLISYKSLRGVRWWFSLTHCAEVKLVKFFRIVENKEIVKCLPEKLDVARLLQEKDYDFEVQLPDSDIHIKWVEASVVHYLRHHRQVNDSAIENLLVGIPKRVNKTMGPEAKLTGYGMHAQQGWSLIKFTIALAIAQFFGLAFFVYWLFHHPGDLQNAAIPNFMILAFMGAAIVIPDIYIP